MSHSHNHNQSRELKNTPVRILYVCLIINLLFVAAEALAGWQSNSAGLLSDDGHNLRFLTICFRFILYYCCAVKLFPLPFCFKYIFLA